MQVKSKCMNQQSDVEFVPLVGKQQLLAHIEHYFFTRSEKSESSVRKKVLSLHSLHSLHSLQSAWSAFWGDRYFTLFELK